MRRCIQRLSACLPETNHGDAIAPRTAAVRPHPYTASSCPPRLPHDSGDSLRSQPHTTTLPHHRPIPNSYPVPGAALYAGEYPGTAIAASSRAKLTAMLDAGITAFIDLTGPDDGMTSYVEVLQSLASARGISVTHDQLTIPDMGICAPDQMHRILDTMEARLAAGGVAYVHCWGGVGRTGTVVGCWLVRQQRNGASALREVGALFDTMSAEKCRRHAGTGSPQTTAQRAMVATWADNEPDIAGLVDVANTLRDDAARAALAPPPPLPLAPSSARDDIWTLVAPNSAVTPAMRDRMRGALIGLAVGDAVGTTVEFSRPGTFTPVTDMVGGGPFGLEPGQWTDDTSMALCLADSVIACRGFVARDQMERYLRWSNEGYLSSTDRCFDIGNTVRAALWQYRKTNDPFAGSTDEQSAGNGSLMRLAPIPIFYFGAHGDAIAMAAESSRTTHGTTVAVDACRYLAALITGALGGATKEEILSAHYCTVLGYWDDRPLHPIIAAIADGSFKRKMPPEIRGTGYVAESLEAALWAFDRSDDFRTGCLLAVNLGDDADTTAAIFGQLAGAYYGESAIPREWRERLARKPLLDGIAESLFQHAFNTAPIDEPQVQRANIDARSLIAAEGGDVFAALRRFVEQEEAEIRETGVVAYYTGGSLHARSTRDYLVLLLRIEAGLRLVDGDDMV